MLKLLVLTISNSVRSLFSNFINYSNICIVQADALNLPLKQKLFMVHFQLEFYIILLLQKQELMRHFYVLKKNGKYSICVYAKGSYYDTKILKFYRKMFNILCRFFAFSCNNLCYFMVQFISPLLNKLRLSNH